MGFFSDLQLRLRDASSDAEAAAIEREVFGGSSGAGALGIDAASLARLFGGEANGNAVRAPGEGHSPEDRSLSIFIDPSDPDGFKVYSFAGDDWKDDRDYVKRKIDEGLKAAFQGSLDRVLSLSLEEGLAELSLPSAAPETSWPTAPAQARRSAEANRAKAAQLWHQSHPVLCPSAKEYVASRGLAIPVRMIGPVFRYGFGFWPSQLKRTLRCDQLIAVVRDVLTDEGVAIHRTRLPHVGKGPDRRFLGSPNNGAIKLTSHEDVIAAGELTIGEGWETCLAAMMMGHKHVWSLCNANGVANLPIMPGIRKLTILAEHDAANEKARDQCADRWLNAGAEVIFDWPDEGFKDHADELFARRAAK